MTSKIENHIKMAELRMAVLDGLIYFIRTYNYSEYHSGIINIVSISADAV